MNILGQCTKCGSQGRYEGAPYPMGADVFILDGPAWVTSTCCGAMLRVMEHSGFDEADPNYPLTGLPVYGGPDDGGTFTLGPDRTTGTAFISGGYRVAPVYEWGLRKGGSVKLKDGAGNTLMFHRCYTFTGMYAVTKASG